MKVEINRAKAEPPTSLYADRDGTIWVRKASDDTRFYSIHDDGIGIDRSLSFIVENFGPLKRFTGTVTLSNED